MNNYYKYCPNVFLAKCEEKHEAGEVIDLETRRGKINEHIVFNLIFEKDGFYYYSIVRADGFDVKKWAERKAERFHTYAENAEKKSNEAYQKSNKDREFLSLGEPIKVGHHSEGRHRKMIENAQNNMSKCVEFSNKAEKYERKARKWEDKTDIINLSMPESLEYYEEKLKEAKAKHKEYKEHPEKREHSYSLTYAKKEVNNLNKSFETAKRLWG